MDDCLFCRISAGTVPANRLYEDDEILCFADSNPQAPLHAVCIPKIHITNLNQLEDTHDALMGRLLRQAAALAQQQGFADAGYRFVTNCGPAAGQTVRHVHMHVLGGRTMHWPPG